VVEASVDKDDLLERYEATGDEAAYEQALPLFEQAIRNGADATTFRHYGYLLECHARALFRRAVEQYERAIELEPNVDKPRYQLIGARAALRETELPIAEYEKRLATSPDDIRWYRLLANAYLAAHAFDKAREVVNRGLPLAPDDWMLTYCRGEVRARTGDPDGALADWRRALELDTGDISALYSSAFLLEREGRVLEAIVAWRSIIDWCETRGYDLTAEWPKRELERLQRVASG
jgi:tetratricopeptide (TPR) repeat protein